MHLPSNFIQLQLHLKQGENSFHCCKWRAHWPDCDKIKYWLSSNISIRKRREQERESKREKCVEDKYDKFDALFRYIYNLTLNFPCSMSIAKQSNAKKCAACFHFSSEQGSLVTLCQPQNQRIFKAVKFLPKELLWNFITL